MDPNEKFVNWPCLPLLDDRLWFSSVRRFSSRSFQSRNEYRIFLYPSLFPVQVYPHLRISPHFSGKGWKEQSSFSFEPERTRREGPNYSCRSFRSELNTSSMTEIRKTRNGQLEISLREVLRFTRNFVLDSLCQVSGIDNKRELVECSVNPTKRTTRVGWMTIATSWPY